MWKCTGPWTFFKTSLQCYYNVNEVCTNKIQTLASRELENLPCTVDCCAESKSLLMSWVVEKLAWGTWVGCLCHCVLRNDPGLSHLHLSKKSAVTFALLQNWTQLWSLFFAYSLVIVQVLHLESMWWIWSKTCLEAVNAVLFFKIMAEIKTFRHWHDSESDRNTVLMGKSVRPSQGPAVPAVLMDGEPATGISENPFLSFAHSSPI